MYLDTVSHYHSNTKQSKQSILHIILYFSIRMPVKSPNNLPLSLLLRLLSPSTVSIYAHRIMSQQWLIYCNSEGYAQTYTLLHTVLIVMC